MVAKEIFSDQEAGSYEERTLLPDPYEEEETLSLCDLPTYSTDSADCDDYFSKEEGQSSSQSNDDGDDDFFEFSSEDFTTSTHETTEKNIIFCGKLIPFKDPKQQDKSYQNDGVNLPWRPNTCDKAKPIMSRTSVIPCDAKGSKNNNNNKLCDYASIKKVSLMRSTTKSRWYLFMFGTRVSTEMELSDIRSRQSRQSPVTMVPASEQGREMVKSKGKRRNMKGLLRILKSLDFGCLSSNVVKKSAFV